MKLRRETILSHARDLGCSAVATVEPENLFYMTGFWGEAVGLLEEDGSATIIAPTLEAERARSESVDCDVVAAERGTDLVSSLASRIGSGRTCLDCRDYSTVQAIRGAAPGAEPSAEPFHRSRIVKDAAEIAILEEASSIIDDMFDLCTNTIRVGQTESELQAELMSYAASRRMFDTGYRFTTNPLIVAGGPNGALPHAQVTGRRFCRGEMIVVDLTLRYRGYISDATRTFALGSIPDEARNAYGIVRESQELGLGAVAPGVPGGVVDEACRNHIDGAGYGRYFIHSTGHGIGLDVHELPSVSAGVTEKLLADMAITVEPGIYMPGRFGVRIEDSLIVANRPAVMHQFTKELITL